MVISPSIVGANEPDAGASGIESRREARTDAPPASQLSAAATPLTPDIRQTIPHDLTPWRMVLAADSLVKAVMIILAAASLASWTVLVAKLFEFSVERRVVRAARGAIQCAASFTEAKLALEPIGGVAANLVAAAEQECALSAGLAADGIRERVKLALTQIEQGAVRKMRTGTGALATVGSTAPFLGLFGTVWGIMNSFIGISRAQTTNLAVVAPGIAEALLATALGLFAAIPAVVIFNLVTRAISSHKALLADLSTDIIRSVGRDLDRGILGRHADMSRKATDARRW